ncbi:2968_t:CDS:2, partial [Cetraspora pellucida]
MQDTKNVVGTAIGNARFTIKNVNTRLTNPRRANDQPDSEGIKRSLSASTSSAIGNDESQDSICDINESLTGNEIVDAETTNDESESPVEEITTKKSDKMILSWGHVVDKIKISDRSNNDVCIEIQLSPRYSISGHNILKDFRNFQINTIERLKNNPTLSYATDVDEIFTGNNAMDEDTFVHRYCHLMLEEIFNMTNYELVWANRESNSSKEQRKSDGKKHGRKPDFR